MEVYLDVLFLENIVMNYLILSVTAKFSKIKATNLRILLGALIGAAYVAFMVLLPGEKVYYAASSKILLSLVIVAVTFSPRKIGVFIKTLSIFYLSTFIFAGAAFAFLYFNQNGGFIRNGIVYVFWQSKWTVMFLSILLAGIIVKIFWEILQQKFVKEKLLVKLMVVFEEKAIDMNALIDTGNSLHDPLSDMPVVVAEYNALKEILPHEIKNIFEESKENDLESVTCIISGSEWVSRFRLIPFKSLGKENGMLIGFKPDYIEVSGTEEEKKGISNVIIGIYNRTLSRNEEYRALLGPELI